MKRVILRYLPIAAFVVLVISAVFTSCKKEVELIITLESETVEFATNPSGTETVAIQSNTNWSIAIEQTDNWLSVTPMSGNGDATLTMTAQVNDDFAERYATIIVQVAGDETKIIAVAQAGDETKDIILLEEINYSDGRRYVLEYDEQRRISKRYYYYSSEVSSEILTLTYSEDLVTISHPQYDDIYPTFVENGNIINYNIYDVGGSYEIKLNDRGIPEKYTIRWRGIMYPGWRTTVYTYTWMNGNLVKADYEAWGESWGEKFEESGTEIYTYDDKKSPFLHSATPKWFIWWWFGDCSVNNVKSKGATIYEYTYNEYGFRATEKQDNVTITYTYMKRTGKE